ncbi:ATP-binding protein [Streptomyces tateyamensis]|uniref:ATP-binding protein n=1 Tax=Streptomyces tateyamensis TaxID=565073 RepID=UPI0015E8911C|nr:ATP-binding protein [Streptomyces tateyamensis]
MDSREPAAATTAPTSSITGRCFRLAHIDQPGAVLDTLTCVVRPHASAVAATRRRVHDHFAGRISVDLLDDLELVLSELVANALAASRPEERVEITVEQAGSSLLIEVVDQSAGAPRCRQSGLGDERGRGLLIVEALTSAWGWQRRGAAKVVWGLLAI